MRPAPPAPGRAAHVADGGDEVVAARLKRPQQRPLARVGGEHDHRQRRVGPRGERVAAAELAQQPSAAVGSSNSPSSSGPGRARRGSASRSWFANRAPGCRRPAARRFDCQRSSGPGRGAARPGRRSARPARPRSPRRRRRTVRRASAACGRTAPPAPGRMDPAGAPWRPRTRTARARTRYISACRSSSSASSSRAGWRRTPSTPARAIGQPS